MPKIGELDGKAIIEREFQAYLAVKGVRQTSESQRSVLMDRYLEEAALAAAIEKEAGESLDRIEAEVAEFRRQRLIRAHFDQLLAQALSNEAVEHYVAAHAEDFQQREARVAHLLVRTTSAMSEAEKSKKRQQAQALLKQAQRDGFAKVAEEHSQDRASAPRGGELGWIGPVHLGESAFKAALTLKVDEVAGPIESAHGYHLITLLELPREIPLTSEATTLKARSQIRQSVLEDERERLLALSGLSKRAQTPRSEPSVTKQQEFNQPVSALQPKPLRTEGM